MDYDPTRECQLKKEELSARIIFLMMHADESLVTEAFRCGFAQQIGRANKI